jgi:hypothetical protein
VTTNPTPSTLRPGYCRDGYESYVLNTDHPERYARFHLDASNKGTLSLIATGSPDVPLETLEWLIERARQLQAGAA